MHGTVRSGTRTLGSSDGGPRTMLFQMVNCIPDGGLRTFDNPDDGVRLYLNWPDGGKDLTTQITGASRGLSLILCVYYRSLCMFKLFMKLLHMYAKQKNQFFTS